MTTWLLAQTQTTQPSNLVWIAFASLVMGIAAGWLAAVMAAIIFRDVATSAQSWEFDEARRIRLRRDSVTYRCFEPLIDEIVNLRPLHVLGSIGQVRKSLLAAAVALPWTAEEFLGTKAIEALGVGLGVGLLLARGDFDTGATIVIALAAGLAYLRFSVGRLQTTARRRLQRFKQRLPFGIDLVALMMAAGSGFRESLATLVHESQQHPVGDEFGKLLRGLERGQSLRESLGHLQERLQDPDVKEMVFAVQKAEELGTPLSRVFFSMAEQMRLKRSQWLEKAAGKAQTMITFPGLLIMVACLLLVTAPFVIDAVQNSQF